MKKILSIIVICLLFDSMAFAESIEFHEEIAGQDKLKDKLSVSIENWNKQGSFDYYLHYSNSSQILSKVSAPQNQIMTIYSLEYKPTEWQSVRLKYGMTGVGNNGRGDDTDWTTAGSGTATYYGTMDFYGKEKIYSLDWISRLSKHEKQETNVVVGFEKNTTGNELKNIVYNLVDGVNVGNQGQEDNGSTLDGNFYGIRFGLENRYQIKRKLFLDSSLLCRVVKTEVNGYWANHDPAWTWTDKGTALGYEGKIGLAHYFNKDVSFIGGYYTSYLKMKNGDEVLNEGNGIMEVLNGLIDIHYSARGYYWGIAGKF